VSGFMTGWMYDELPDWVKKDLLVCDRWGGSRLRLAQKYDWRINCIVSDFDNRFPNAPILRTISEIESKFGNKPVKIEMHKYGVIITPNKLTH